ncbi:bifunctional adenosylcobinamide kinase/adenosylcobinamide-phosphate guanylyltransferase [Sporosarcina sp. PTS2304]|uniref:bifunctional adenosylcobinamide kinase/adenosylcobinamide-phosphate guanylyltransferase n=1 Tax=Sporosarcina sp. PTS2304 TaxID=2283194 RepID=UPI0013B37BFF|nr:bifunctional adenosylcobinamide kinase/adenosylcobinamide-phosphate guanylyltransferase [Sporosarcina sp. PTS2304]
MHVIIGGAYNGKTEYVRRLVGDQKVEFCTMETAAMADGRLVIVGLLDWLRQTEMDEAQSLQAVRDVIEPDTIFILTEVGRGIVPFEAEQRELRDQCGRLYQYLFAQAIEVTRVWYGIPQQIKGVK